MKGSDTGPTTEKSNDQTCHRACDGLILVLLQYQIVPMLDDFTRSWQHLSKPLVWVEFLLVQAKSCKVR